MLAKIIEIEKNYHNLINGAQSLEELDQLFLKLFGKNGEITLIPAGFSKLEKEEIKKISPVFNRVKSRLEKAIDDKREQVRERFYQELEREQFSGDLEGGIKKREGKMHPVTRFEKEIVEIFSKLGFKQFDGPQIDTDYNNFEVLNIPKEHPARDLWDTLYIDGSKYGFNLGELLLRTHTSNSQIRMMKENSLPLRMMVNGRCFRYENLDARHEHTFEQFELLYIDKGVSMANLQYLSEYFLSAIFGEEIKVRLRPKYYPFVEPGAGVDGLCIFCKGKGCKVCGGVGWLELAGAGMVHPNVLKNGGIDPDEYSGIAWGFGTFRVAMIKYGYEDMRIFNSGELKIYEREKGGKLR